MGAGNRPGGRGRARKEDCVRICDVIGWVDEVKPNAFPDRVKLEWLNALEGRVMAGVFLLSEAGVAEYSYKYPRDMEAELMVKQPHDDMYGLWLCAKVDEANGEYDRYANSSRIFNAHYANFVCWFADVYEPARGHAAEHAPRNERAAL